MLADSGGVGGIGGAFLSCRLCARGGARRRRVEGLSTGSWPCTCADARRSSAPCRHRTGAASCRLMLPRVEPVCVCMSAGSMCAIAWPGCAIISGRRSALTAASRCRVIFESRLNRCVFNVCFESTDRIRTSECLTGHWPSQQQMTRLRAVTQSKLIYTPLNNSSTGVFSGK